MKLGSEEAAHVGAMEAACALSLSVPGRGRCSTLLSERLWLQGEWAKVSSLEMAVARERAAKERAAALLEEAKVGLVSALVSCDQCCTHNAMPKIQSRAEEDVCALNMCGQEQAVCTEYACSGARCGCGEGAAAARAERVRGDGRFDARACCRTADRKGPVAPACEAIASDDAVVG